MTIKKALGSFSEVSGSSVRIVYSEDGRILGTVRKLESKQGYRLIKTDGTVRVKPTLAAAYKSIRRSN